MLVLLRCGRLSGVKHGTQDQGEKSNWDIGGKFMVLLVP